MTASYFYIPLLLQFHENLAFQHKITPRLCSYWCCVSYFSVCWEGMNDPTIFCFLFVDTMSIIYWSSVQFVFVPFMYFFVFSYIVFFKRYRSCSNLHVLYFYFVRKLFSRSEWTLLNYFSSVIVFSVRILHFTVLQLSSSWLCCFFNNIIFVLLATSSHVIRYWLWMNQKFWYKLFSHFMICDIHNL